MNRAPRLDLLACPSCHGALAREGAALVCGACGDRYAAGGEWPELIPADVARNLMADGDPAWSRWREAVRGLEAWRAARSGPTGRAFDDGTSTRAIRALFERAGVKGVVVDVGAKDAAKSTWMKDVDHYVGVDPFPSRASGLPPHVTLVRGVAEALPLHDRSVDAVVSVSAFDYFQDGFMALDEMARVLKPSGRLALLVSVVSATVANARGARSRSARVVGAIRAMREVGVTAGAGLVGAALTERDRPHTHYYSRNQVTSMVGVRFEIEGIEESVQPASTILYVHAHKKRNTRLPVLR